MKRTLLILTAALVAVSMAGWVQTYIKNIGNATGNTIRGTAADTLTIPLGVISGATWLTFGVRADSVVDSVPNLVAKFQFKPWYTATYTSLNFATEDAGDTILPLDGWVVDTTTTATVLYPYYSSLWSWNASARIILTGKRAGQCAKACSVRVLAFKP